MDQVEFSEEFTRVTREIRVTVKPVFLDEESDIEEAVFAHSYTVTIENLSRETVQLINRHWIVLSAGRQIADVKGEGVVGQQPVLRPGDSFQYTSWSIVKDPVGEMCGSYTFYGEKGEFFDVEIPAFSLIYVNRQAVH